MKHLVTDFPRYFLRCAQAAFAVAALTTSLRAQTAAPGDAPLELEKVVTEGKLAEDSVVPVVRPIASVLGYAGNVLDAPRAVSTITKGQLTDRNVQRIEDLSQFVAGAFTAPIFGNAGVPTIRGDLGEAYQNGQRKAFNRNSFPISFNGVEAVDAVKGAPPAFFGYGNATGGYVNFVTKQPFFDKQRTAVRAIVGDWDSYRWQLDTGGPLSSKLAYRVSYEGSDAGSFYRLVNSDSQSVFAALSYRPNSKLSFDFNAEFLNANFTENPGTTRPTQDLIDHGIYITGSSVVAQGGATNSYFSNTFTPTGTVKIDGSQTLLAPGDGAWAEVFNAQLIGTLALNDAMTLVNRSYYESVQAEKHSSYYFYSYLPQSYTFENRTELQWNFETKGLKHQLLAGVSARYEYRKSYVDILNEVFDAFDVTMDPSTLVLPRNQLFFVFPVPGKSYLATPGGRYPRPGLSLSTGLSATLGSDTGAAGVFLQDQIQLASRWSLLLGGRVDELWVHSKDPLPRPGNAPVHASIQRSLPSGSASLTFKPADWNTLYVTFNHAAAVEGSSSSGGFGLTGNQLLPATFENSSVLIEAGAKAALLKNRLFVSTAVYNQKRNRTNVRFNLPDEIEVNGIEAEAVYEPNQQFNLGVNATYSHANYVNGPLPGSIQTIPGFSPSTPSGNFGAFAAGDYRVPGLPLWMANAYATYTLPSGFGASLSVSLQGEQNLDLLARVRIPSQQTWNAAAFYRARKWELRVDFLNLTDEFNWRATSTPFAGADLVTREVPFNVRGSFTYRF